MRCEVTRDGLTENAQKGFRVVGRELDHAFGWSDVGRVPAAPQGSAKSETVARRARQRLLLTGKADQFSAPAKVQHQQAIAMSFYFA